MIKPVFLCFFWVPCVLILTSLNTHFTRGTCLEDQQSLLLQLRTTLIVNLSKSHKLATWNQTSDCCEWRGIQCDDSTRQVIGLDLCCESITGGIDNSSSLFSLRFLQSLNLANNNFNNAHIPSAFSKLSRLTYLNLSNAGFSGQVPLEISQLIKLETLDLSSDSYMGFTPPKLEDPGLGMLIRNLTNIRKLCLNGVIISANGSKLWKGLSSSVPNLQVLSLSNCNLSGGIDSSLEKLQSLSEIALAQNNLVGPVPDFIANFRNLTVLNVSGCKLTGTVPQRIHTVPTLRSLDLSYNTLLQGTLPEFPVNSSLQNLILSYTNFYGQLPNSIGNLMQLNRIELQNCTFSGLIPSSMAGLEHLVYLDFSINNFFGPIPKFAAARNLAYLDYSSNRFTSIHSDIGNSLSSALFLSLSRNNISGVIPVTLCNATVLRVLDLSDNNLSGTIPDCVIKMTRTLGVFDLGGNLLNGTIPDAFPEDCSLSIIDFSENMLQGQLPRSLTKCGKLEVLNLRGNQLHDTFPSWWMNLSNLRTLVLRGNKLNGSIACAPSQTSWSVLQIIDLASNDFNGELKGQCFLKLTGLMAGGNDVFRCIDFSDNEFNGKMPEAIGNLNGLIALNLSHNALSGSIPPTIGNLSMLESLDFSYNYLQENIPRELANLHFLDVLNLSYNKLVGLIPTGQQLQTFDESSYIGNMGLCGSPLPTCSIDTLTPSTLPSASPATGFNWKLVLLVAGLGTVIGLEEQVNKLPSAILTIWDWLP